MPELLSVNVGLPQDLSWRGKAVRSAIWKHSVFGRRYVRSLNIDGDKQGDLKSHGGIYRAVLVYQYSSYLYWQDYFKRSDFSYGQFGENFTITDMPDSEVRIGDTYRIGTAIFQVTEPRVTCYRVGIRMGAPDMAALLVAHHRPGFYMRVLQEGEVGAGDDVIPEHSDPADPTVSELDALLYLPNRNWRRMQDIVDREILSPVWQRALVNTLASHNGTGWTGGTPGITLNNGCEPAWYGYRPLRISAKKVVAKGIVALTLSDPLKTVGVAAVAGQFISIKVPGTNATRTYSMTDTTVPDALTIAVKLLPQGAASNYIEHGAAVGSAIDCAAPRGTFVLPKAETPAVFITAGIGLTPVIAMLRSLLQAVMSAPVVWLHSCKNSAVMPFRDAIKDLAERLPNLRTHIFYTAPQATDVFGSDYDHRGRIAKQDVLANLLADANYYVCGPLSFMDDVRGWLAEGMVRKENIRIERFGEQEGYTPGLVGETRAQPTPHRLVADDGQGPLVSFVRSGVAAHWNKEKFSTLLELAEACDIAVRWGCRTGVCHKCITSIVEGAGVEYDPEPLDRPGRGNILTCCSQPSGDIVLDL